MPKRRRHQQASIAWGNPYTHPPSDVPTLEGNPRCRWAVTFLVDEHRQHQEIIAAHAPTYKPGAGWGQSWGSVYRDPPRRWSPEAKARRRQSNLRRRLDKALPLFAADLFAAELAARPAYFRGE